LPPFRPHPALRTRVVSIDVVENDGRDLTVLPSTSAVLGIQFRGGVLSGGVALAPAGVTGIQPTARTYSYAEATGSVLVRFTPEGAACLGIPATELAGRSVALDELLPRARVAEVHGRVGEAPDDRARVAAVQDFLASLPLSRDHAVARAIRLLEAATDEARVAAVARTLGLSERQLERRFQARVGITPKRFASLRRFERAVAGAAMAPSLTAAALDAGYYDQSHFIRDFRRFAGASPRQILSPPR
jgi:AraC-like DNA-binding protein